MRRLSFCLYRGTTHRRESRADPLRLFQLPALQDLQLVNYADTSPARCARTFEEAENRDARFQAIASALADLKIVPADIAGEVLCWQMPFHLPAPQRSTSPSQANPWKHLAKDRLGSLLYRHLRSRTRLERIPKSDALVQASIRRTTKP